MSNKHIEPVTAIMYIIVLDKNEHLLSLIFKRYKPNSKNFKLCRL